MSHLGVSKNRGKHEPIEVEPVPFMGSLILKV